MKHALALFAMVVPLAGLAEVYRCQDGATTVFSSAPCGPGAKAVVVKPASGFQSVESAGKADRVDSALVGRADVLSRRRILDDDIWRKQRQISALQAEHEGRQAELRAKKARANNNLAGATWEKSVSEEMQSVAYEYDTRTRVLLKELEEMQARRRDLDSLK